MKNQSPLRYPGGKTRACKILTELFKKHFDPLMFNHVISPFFGGGSFEFHLQSLFHYKIIANDKFKPLYIFWTQCKLNKENLVDSLLLNIGTITKEIFVNIRETILHCTDTLNMAIKYFIVNRCSFSGATLSGGFSKEASNKRFTKSSIDKIKKLDLTDVSFENKDFVEFLNIHRNKPGVFMFIDPPYYLDNSKLYGNNGDLHEHFNHQKLFEMLKNTNNWMLTYNNHPFIKDLYKDYLIIPVEWSYGMNKSKESSEIVIIKN